MGTGRSAAASSAESARAAREGNQPPCYRLPYLGCLIFLLSNALFAQTAKLYAGLRRARGAQVHLLSGSTCCTHSLYLAEQPTRAVVPRSCATRDACWQRGAHNAQSKKSASDGVLSPSSPRTAPTALRPAATWGSSSSRGTMPCSAGRPRMALAASRPTT